MRKSLGGKIPIIGTPTQSGQFRQGDLPNEFVAKVVTVDVLYFAPTPDVTKPIKISDILESQTKTIKDLYDVMQAVGRDMPQEQVVEEMIRILDTIVAGQKSWFTNVERFTHQLYDIAETDDSEIDSVTTRLNKIVAEFQRDTREGRNPKYYNVLLSKVVASIFGISDSVLPQSIMHLNFIAAHGTGRDSMSMIRAIPFPSTRLFLMDWMLTNHGPMAMARITHAPRHFDDGLPKGRVKAPTSLVIN